MTFLAIVEYYKSALTKSKFSLFSFAIQPVSFIFIVYVISGGRFLASAMAGAMVSFIVGVGMADLPIELVGMKVRSKFYDIIMGLPGSTFEKMLGISVGMSLPALPYLVVLSALLLAQSGASLLAPLLLGGLTLWLWSVSVGMLMGARIKEPLTVMRLSNVTVTLITIFPPVYYPLALLPEKVRPIALLLPTVSASHLMSGGREYGTLAVASLLLWAGLSLGLGILMEMREE
ncbi:multidrug transporter [Thermococcus sp. M36]|uniref:multidrug transporter n=1 Tax=Thermococcus sp. M36 TaxID=1638261 RepID=UPI00143994D8|nr:multidrug transporter [Thermococcus sp. M36]NJE06055.1 multidrug transporter [Thermococcus sp. M36]